MPRTLAIAAFGLMLVFGRGTLIANAAQVGGTLSGNAGHQLHFENRATRDIYMAVTDRNGAFAVDLPPGIYDLRGQRGTIFVPRILVADQAINLGAVSKPTGFNPMRLFQYEGVAPVLVYTPAPATAYLPGGAEGITAILPSAPVTGAFSQKGGAGGTPITPSAGNPTPPPASSQLTPVPGGAPPR